MKFEKLKPYLFVMVLQFGNAGMALIGKTALNQGMNHYTFATYRALIAALVLAPFALFFERLEKVNIKKLHSIGKIVGTLVTLGGAMIMTIVVGPTIVLPWTKGSTTTHHQQSTTHVSHGDNIKGSMMIIAGCFLWSCFYIGQAITLRSYPAELSLTVLICAAGALQGSIVTLIAEKGNNEVWRLHLDAGLVTIIYSGVICSGLGYYLSGIIMNAKGPVFLTSFNPVSMVIVAVLGSIILAESLNVGRVVGAVVIVIGLYLVIWGKSKDESQSNSKCDPDELPPVDHQQLPMTISSTGIGNDSVAIVVPPTKING